MPLIFQEAIDSSTRLGIWKIEEDIDFFRTMVPQHRLVTHPRKMLQHLAGRFLLGYLFPNFPVGLIQVADTKKPFLPDDLFHFSISHCGDYAAAIVSAKNRVGIDIEIPVEKVKHIERKFISPQEKDVLNPLTIAEYTQIWSAKEAVFKWYGLGGVDFREDIQLKSVNENPFRFECFFKKTESTFDIFLSRLSGLCLSYISTSAS